MAEGSLALILHAHLPFVRHPEHEVFLEEDWLFEAISETYLPLLRLMRRLVDEGVDFRLTFSLTPTLCEMLRDELLQARYLRHLDRVIALAHRELERNRDHPPLAELSRFYAAFFTETRDFFENTLRRDVVGAFRALQDAGVIEIMASAATHAFLPLLENFPSAQRAQIRIGCDSYRKMFGREARGFWLPECGYSTGLDLLLQEANVRWSVLDTHGLMFAQPRPLHAIYAPSFTPAGPAVFARDQESNREVWSAESGYPGDPVYRDFYRDLGFDRSEEELRPFLPGAEARRFTGLKFHRITGATGEKEYYQPGPAAVMADDHAEDFLRKGQTRAHALRQLNLNPVIVSPFDAELFGHWWFEGPRFLETFLRRAAGAPESLRLTTPAEFLAAQPTQQVVRPNPSSWGENGFSNVWLDEQAAWVYPLLHAATGRMIALAQQHQATSDPAIERGLRQAARELLLAQASDWAFLIKTRSAPEYAEQRTRDHLDRFQRLATALEQGEIDCEFLGQCEERAKLFPDLNWRYFC